MPESSSIYTELERNNRISAELARISIYFENLPENKQSITFPLLQNAAFMRITLDDLQAIIAEQGPVEAYQNGEYQYGMKQSAALQSYNSLIKNYAATVKTLFGLLPPMERPKSIQNLEKLNPSEKTEEELEEKRHEEDVLRAKRNIEMKRASEYQKWMREQEQSGEKINMSFSNWMAEHPITDGEIEAECKRYDDE